MINVEDSRSTGYAFILLIVIFSLLHLLYIGQYSYWYDELYSVSAANETHLSRWFSFWIVVDMHPPLYQFILFWFVKIFGSSELATRLISWFFVTLAGLWLALDRRSRLPARVRQVSAAILILTPSCFVYSQETRSYGLLIFAGVLLQSAFGRSIAVKKPTWDFLLSALLASSIHLFGVIYAGILITILLARSMTLKDWRASSALVATGGLCLFWVVLLVTFGEVLNYTGGHHAIHWSTHVPIDIASKLAAVTTVLVLFFSLIWWRPNLIDYFFESRFEVIAIIAFFGSTFVVSLHTPIFQGRNYLIALPTISVLFARFICLASANSTMWTRRSVAVPIAIILTVVFACENIAWMQYRKWAPTENYRDIAQYIIHQASGPEMNVGIIPASPEINPTARGPETARVRLAETFYFRYYEAARRFRLTFILPSQLNDIPPGIEYVMSVHHVDEIAEARARTKGLPQFQELQVRSNNPNGNLLLKVKDGAR